MGPIWKSIVLAAMIAVAAVLILGLANMASGGSANTSQKLMRLRVVLQLLAIIIILTAFLFVRS